MTIRDLLVHYAIKHKGDYFKIISAINKKEPVDYLLTSKQTLTILDEQYPKALRNLKYPPLVLFYKGNVELLNNQTCGIIGSRSVCDYASKMVHCVTEELKKKYTIVSGLAKGIDALVHQNSLTNQTIGVIGCGIDTIYPLENKELYEMMEHKHLILSEYPEQVAPLKHHFPWRNRIIAALSNFLVVVSAEQRSGTLTTVNAALDLSKDVYVIPYPNDNIYGKGCNQLIKEGAHLLMLEDVKFL